MKEVIKIHRKKNRQGLHTTRMNIKKSGQITGRKSKDMKAPKLVDDDKDSSTEEADDNMKHTYNSRSKGLLKKGYLAKLQDSSSHSKLKIKKNLRRSNSPQISYKAFIEFKKQLPRFDILYGQPLPFDSSYRSYSKIPKLHKE